MRIPGYPLDGTRADFSLETLDLRVLRRQLDGRTLQ